MATSTRLSMLIKNIYTLYISRQNYKCVMLYTITTTYNWIITFRAIAKIEAFKSLTYIQLEESFLFYLILLYWN